MFQFHKNNFLHIWQNMNYLPFSKQSHNTWCDYCDKYAGIMEKKFT